MINRKRKLTPKKYDLIARKLGWPKQEDESFASLDSDQFGMVEHWYNYALLELARLGDYSPEPKDIAKRLSVSLWEAAEALELLKRLGLLNEQGYLNKKVETTTKKVKIPEEKLKALQKQMLNKASMALDFVDESKRDQSTLVMAIDENKVAEAKQMLAEFRRKFCVEIENSSKPNSVYQLSLSFYPVTKEQGK